MAAVRGQSALDGFDPGANEAITAIAVQPDGKILLGGGFTTIGGGGTGTIARNHIARLNPDGTVDAGFDPNANGSVRAIAVQPDGKILVAGAFTTLGGPVTTMRRHLARLNQDGTLDPSFNPNVNADVYTLALQADGRVLVGGLFTFIGTSTRNHIARLNPEGILDMSFDPGADDNVFVITVQADGRILVGGRFGLLGGGGLGANARRHVGRLNPDGTLDTNFDPGADNDIYALTVQPDGKILVGGLFATLGGGGFGISTRRYIGRINPDGTLDSSFNPGANEFVFGLVLQADGKILAAGKFTTLGGGGFGTSTRKYIGRINPDGTLDGAFNPGANDYLWTTAVQQDGKILAIGWFTGVGGGSGTTTRNRIARLETDGRLDQTLNLSLVGNYLFATAVQADGKILIGGQFTNVLGVARSNIARLNTDGTLDTAFNPSANNNVFSIAVQADGKILAGGDFTSIGGQTRNRVARLNRDGTLDTAFNPNVPNVPNTPVDSIAVQADGKILAAGYFTSIGGQPRNHIARLDATTGLADSFNPNPDGVVVSIAVQADGKILAGGGFGTIGGQPRNRIARLDAITGATDSFDPNANDFVGSIAVQTDGKVLAGGYFTSISGQTRYNIARLNPTNGLPDSFDPHATNEVVSIALQADGKILAGGQFEGIGGQTRNYIARLDATAGAADLFDPNADNEIRSMAVQADGKILVGGDFESVGGQPRRHFARITNDTAALQNLTATQTAITWTSGGSNPQFTRVTFEYSTDNVNYTPLGSGTSSGSALGPDRLKPCDGTEPLHSRSRLLSQRLLERLGEHRGIGAECVYRSIATYNGRFPQDAWQRRRLRYLFAAHRHARRANAETALAITSWFLRRPILSVTGNASVTTGTGSVSRKSDLRRQYYDREPDRCYQRADNDRYIERRDR